MSFHPGQVITYSFSHYGHWRKLKVTEAAIYAKISRKSIAPIFCAQNSHPERKQDSGRKDPGLTREVLEAASDYSVPGQGVTKNGS